MSQDSELKRKKLRTGIILLIMVLAIYLVVIFKQW